MKKNKIVKEWIEPLCIALLIALFIRAFIVQTFMIPSGSMEPTLLINDHIFVNKFIYGIRVPFTNIKLFQHKKPKRGDIIVFIFPKDRSFDFIKRVIATEGEKYSIEGKNIYINDQLIEDLWGKYNEKNDWGRSFEKYDFGSGIVPEGHVLVLGDNRDNSQDSRYWGFVDLKNDLIGKAFLIYYSGPPYWQLWQIWRWNEIRWGRMGTLIH